MQASIKVRLLHEHLCSWRFKKQRKNLSRSLRAFRNMGYAVLDEKIEDEKLRKEIFSKINKKELESHVAQRSQSQPSD